MFESNKHRQVGMDQYCVFTIWPIAVCLKIHTGVSYTHIWLPALAESKLSVVWLSFLSNIVYHSHYWLKVWTKIEEELLDKGVIADAVAIRRKFNSLLNRYKEVKEQ